MSGESLRLLVVLLLIVVSPRNGWAKNKNKPMVNGTPIICDKEAYNCPDYKGPYQNKRLKSCADVQLVWKTCKTDIHDLDRDHDGIPCEKDCE